MNHILKQLLPLLLVICYACDNPSEPIISFTTIKGKINHSKAHIHPVGLLTSATRFGMEQPNHLVALDTNGNYRFEVPIKNPTEIRLQYGSYTKILFVEPRSGLTFNKTVSFDVFPNQTDSPDFSLDTLIGTTAERTLKMNKFDELFQDSFDVELNATMSYAIPREFKAHRTKIFKRIEQLVYNYIEKHIDNDPVLASWIKHHSEYRIAMDYMRYAFKGYHNNKSTPFLKENLPVNYFDFIEKFRVNNPAAFPSLNYQNYLHLFRKYLIAKLGQTTEYQDCKSLPNCDIYGLELATLQQHLSGKTLQVMLMQQMDDYLTSNNQRFLKLGYEQYVAALKDSILIQEIRTRKKYLFAERKFDYPDNVTFYQSNGSGEQILTEIRQKHQGRNTLLYFWNTHADLILPYMWKQKRASVWHGLDTMNFDLVLLAHHTTTNYWKEFIIDKGLIKDQWHLKDNQYQFFKDYYEKEHGDKGRGSEDENFILALDETGNLVNAEMPAMPLSIIAHQIKWKMIQQEKARTLGND